MTIPKETKKYQAIILKAKSLFRKHGIRRISVEEICKEAGVSKMTFYRFFANKTELAEVVLKDIVESGFQKYKAVMRQEIPFPEKIKQTILLKHEASTDISEEFLKDVYQGNKSGLKEILDHYMNVSLTEVMNDMKTAQEAGWIRKDLKPDFLLYMMNDIGEKMFDEKLKAMYSDMHDLIMELTNFFFYGISNTSE